MSGESKQPPRVLPHLEKLPGYAPVVPLAERARAAGIEPADALKLDANENPFGMHPQVRAALDEALSAPYFGSIYPDPNQAALRAALAEYTGVGADRIIAGAGADELLDLTLRALLPPGEAVITAPPSFGMYPFLADVNQLQLVEVDRDRDLQLRGEPLVHAADQHGGIVMLTSPNNPTGDLVPPELVRDILDTGAIVVLDEAYIEFASPGASAIRLLDQFPRLIIMRTFSKWAGIAGLRVGYALADPGLIEALIKVKQPYNINQAAEVAAIAALGHAEELRTQIVAIRACRDRLLAALQNMPGLSPLPSESNFILVKVEEGSGKALHDRLAERGVFTRTYSDPRLVRYLRISVPRPDQLESLMKRLRAALAVG